MEKNKKIYFSVVFDSVLGQKIAAYTVAERMRRRKKKMRQLECIAAPPLYFYDNLVPFLLEICCLSHTTPGVCRPIWKRGKGPKRAA